MTSAGSYPILILLALLACSAFFSASETALFSLSRFQLRQLKDKHALIFARIRYLLDRPAALVATTLLGNELTNVAISHILANFYDGHFPSPAMAALVNICTAVPLILVFGEITPKIIAAKTNMSTALFVTPIVWLFYKVSLPLRWIFETVVDLLTISIRRSSPEQAQLKEEDFLQLLEEGKLKGAIEESEQELIENVFGIDDDKVLELSTPLYELFTVREDTPVAVILDKIRQNFFARIPVLNAQGAKVIGILYAKDLLKYIGRESDDASVRLLMKEPLVVDSNMKAEALFRRFRQLKVHIAIIENKQGRALAAITMEDILEQMFGELWEEDEEEE